MAKQYRILDEVCAGPDPQTEAAIVATIRELKGKTTILVISHQSELVGGADVIYELTSRCDSLQNIRNGDALKEFRLKHLRGERRQIPILRGLSVC